MTEGTIIQVKKGYTGRIRGDDGKEYRFNRKSIAEGATNLIQRGRRVTFDVDGEWASNVHLLDEMREIDKVARPTSAVRQRRPQSRPTSGEYRFLNPYNFVRTLEMSDSSVAPLLGRAAPPPHDRYVGLTGRIHCKMTAVTPLFVSDSHRVEVENVEGKDHLHYQFFRDPEGNIAIPASSIRGVIRNVFEAVTNSCFIHLSGEKPGSKRLSYHLPPGEALKLVPGRVRKNGNRWELELLPGTTQVVPGQKPSGPQYAAWVLLYRPLQKSRTRAKAPNTAYSRRHKVSLQGLQHGDSCWAIIEKVQHPLRRFKFWNVVALARKRQDLPKVSDGQRVVQGYLCITNQNIENKHDERLFFRAPDNTSVSQPLELSGTVRQHYEELIADYQERHRDAVQKRRKKGSPDEPLGREPAFSRFITQRTKKDEPKLKDGDLVYATLKRKGMGVEVDFIVPVSVPRVGYRRTIGELLHPDDLSACQDIEHLCPACRTFGWVHPSGKDDSQAAVAYAGRVRFTHACRRPGNGDSGSFSATLSILSTPKPTTTRFYLRPKQGKPRDGLPDSQVNYDADSQILRGRKFYRHHGDQLSEQEYKSPDGRKSDQNRTVHDVQPSGTEFEFTVDFENLAPIELGALLWSLEMEGWHHRIGYAKPLGFGSVIIQVTELEIMNPNSRYQSLVTDGWENVLSSKERWIDEFKTAMAGRYGTEFYKLPNVRDLQALLSDTPPLPVHYPRSTKEPQPEGRNYEWFVGNKRSGRNSGPRLVLPLSEDDDQGFPLIDRFGNKVEE